jgi:DNA-binding response OmpR family regulator
LQFSSVLLIEDNINLRKKFVTHLSYYVGTIYEASNGIEALKLYEQKNPSIIITDIEMPLMDGLEFIQTIRKKNETIPILITTAYSNQKYLFDAIKLHLVEYLVKPIQLELFTKALEQIATILEKQNLSQNIYFGQNFYDPLEKTFTIDGKKIKLTKSEMKFVEILLQHKGHLVTKHIIEDKMYIFKEMGDSALKNIVFKLKRKIGQDIIQTIDRLGYMIE